MARIKHIAIFSDDPPKLAEFYRDVFGMKITGLDDRNNAWVTDGYMDVALLYRRRAEQHKGIHHWGFTLEGEDEKAEVYRKLRERGLEPFDPRSSAPEADRPYVEEAVRDIHGNRFDMTTGMRALRNAEEDERAKEPLPS